jgi:3-ketosteroid 9alpha-monooxygenase subunit B
MTLTAQSNRLGYVLRVAKVIQETADAVSLLLEVPDDLVDRFSFRPGQFLIIAVPSDKTGHVARCYSISGTPANGRDVKITVKRTRDGYASNWLCDNATEGLDLRALPPSGLFTPHDGDEDLLLCAAGSGITPVMSIAKTVLASGRRVALFYANRDRASVIFSAELDELVARCEGRLYVEHWLESERGLPDVNDFAAFSGAFVRRLVYTCGPAPFMELVGRGLKEAGFDPRRTHTEEYRSLSGDPFAPIETHLPDSSATVATVDVSLDGEEHTLSWPADTTLVDVMVTAGIDVPYSCREGECGSCACVLVEGAVAQGNTDALDPEDVEDGYILGCQARPTSDRLTIRF